MLLQFNWYGTVLKEMQKCQHSTGQWASSSSAKSSSSLVWPFACLFKWNIWINYLDKRIFLHQSRSTQGRICGARYWPFIIGMSTHQTAKRKRAQHHWCQDFICGCNKCMCLSTWSCRLNFCSILYLSTATSEYSPVYLIVRYVG